MDITAHFLEGTIYRGDFPVAECAGVLFSDRVCGAFGTLWARLDEAAARSLRGDPLAFYGARGTILLIEILAVRPRHGGASMAFRCEAVLRRPTGELEAPRVEARSEA